MNFAPVLSKSFKTFTKRPCDTKNVFHFPTISLFVPEMNFASFKFFFMKVHIGLHEQKRIMKNSTLQSPKSFANPCLRDSTGDE